MYQNRQKSIYVVNEIVTLFSGVIAYSGNQCITWCHHVSEYWVADLSKFWVIGHIYLLLTYSMVQSRSWEANWFAASQEIPRILWNPKVRYHTHKPSAWHNWFCACIDQFWIFFFGDMYTFSSHRTFWDVTIKMVFKFLYCFRCNCSDVVIELAEPNRFVCSCQQFKP